MTKPRILVTGATGKTGSVVAAELLKAGYRVRALVHREDGRSTQLKAQRGRDRGRGPKRCRACWRRIEGRPARLFLSALPEVAVKPRP